MRAVAIALLLFTLRPVPSDSQQPGSASAQATLRATAEEVLLDLVVRDKKGRLVRDLKRDEIEVYEDGAPQAVKSFRLVEARDERHEEAGPQGSEGAAARGGGAPVQAEDQGAAARVVSLVFDRLGQPDTRRAALEAAREFITTGTTPGTYVGLFVLDARLYPIQPFTHDRELLLRKLEQVGTGSQALFRTTSDQVQLQIKNTLSMGGAAGSLLGGGQPGLGAPSGVDALGTAARHSGLRNEPVEGASVSLPASAEVAGPRPFLQMLARVFDYESRAVPASLDTANLYALAALIREQRSLPGRKTILLMSEGMRVPVDFSHVLRAAISEANRANVAIYALDVRGLTREGTTFEGRNELASATAASAAVVVNAYENDFRIFERSETSLAANSRAVMRDLAESTGGFLVADTNEFRAPVRRIVEEIRLHYEVSYAPPATEYDGRFRKLEVRLKRGGLRAQTRNGYFALPSLRGHPVFPYEAALLHAINASPQPHAFGFHAAAIPFRAGAALTDAIAVFEVPRASLTLAADPAANAYRIRASFLALVKDSQGQVVEKITRDISLGVPLDKRDAFERGNLIFTQPFRLPPGKYRLEAAVRDSEGNRVSVLTSEATLPPPSALALSGIVLARQVEGLETSADPNDPLQFEDKVVTPAISGLFRKSSNAELSLYCVVYPDASAEAQPELSIEFVKDGRPATKMNARLSAAGAGAVPYLARFRTGDFESGRYEAVVTVKQGAATSGQRAVFTVE